MGDFSPGGGGANDPIDSGILPRRGLECPGVVDDAGTAHAQVVTIAQDVQSQILPADAGAVLAVEVYDAPAFAQRFDAAMGSRQQDVADDDVAFGRATDHDRCG